MQYSAFSLAFVSRILREDFFSTSTCKPLDQTVQQRDTMTDDAVLLSNSIREHIDQIIDGITPFDDLEQEHIRDSCHWIESDAPIFRIKKHDIPNKHLVSYFVLFDQANQNVLLVDHKKAPFGSPVVDM